MYRLRLRRDLPRTGAEVIATARMAATSTRIGVVVRTGERAGVPEVIATARPAAATRAGSGERARAAAVAATVPGDAGAADDTALVLAVDACTVVVNVVDTPAAGAATTVARLGRPTADTGEDLASEGASEGASETPVAALLACSESWSPVDFRRAPRRSTSRRRNFRG